MKIMELGIRPDLGLFLILQIHSCWTYYGYYNTKVANKCFGRAGLPSLDFTECEASHMILVKESFQGMGSGERCEFRRGDCTDASTPETASKLGECVGTSQCSLTVSVAWMPLCKSYSSYSTAVYYCIPKDDVADICGRQEHEAFRMGFISSPDYPQEYGRGLDCSCNISTVAGQKLLISFADFHLEWSESCDKDVVQIMDGPSTMPRCGNLPRNYNLTSHSHSISVHFRTDYFEQHKGFWIQLEALGPIKMSCGPSHAMTTSTSSTTSSTSSPSTAPPAVDYGDQESYSMFDGAGLDEFFTEDPFYEDAYPGSDMFNDDEGEVHEQEGHGALDTTPEPHTEFNPMVLIIVGCVIGILIIVLILILVWWLKRRRKKKDISQVSEPSYMPRLTRHRLGARGPAATAPGAATGAEEDDDEEDINGQSAPSTTFSCSSSPSAPPSGGATSSGGGGAEGGDKATPTKKPSILKNPSKSKSKGFSKR